jgi:mono/diheme cytochrome c family protein
MQIVCIAIAWFLCDLTSSTTRPPRPEELAVQAEQILKKNCAECHGLDVKKAQGGLNILSYRMLVGRKAVVPGAPDESELIGRVEDGTMPPYSRPLLSKKDRDTLRAWVQAGAPAFPDKTIGQGYVLESILRDLKKLEEADRPWMRYFSLNHLRGGEREVELSQYRAALEAAVASLSRQPANRVQPAPIEPIESKTIFRIDLRELGWDKKPYDNSKMNLFDLVLLEYPYGVLDTDADSFQELAQLFLLPAGQVRPVPFVRGDWFVWLATEPEFTQDFLQVPFDERRPDPPADPALIGPARRYADGRVSIQGALGELGSARGESELQAVLDTKKFEKSGVRALGSQGAVDRQTWEASFPEIVRALQLGKPIAPVDSTLDWDRLNAPLGDVELKTNHANNQFLPRQDVHYIANNRTGEPFFVEVIGFGEGITRFCKPTLVSPGEKTMADVPNDEKAGKEEILLYASASEFGTYALAGGAGRRLLRDPAKHIKSRIVHPFYLLERGTNGRAELRADPGHMIRQRIVVETVKE